MYHWCVEQLADRKQISNQNGAYVPKPSKLSLFYTHTYISHTFDNEDVMILKKYQKLCPQRNKLHNISQYYFFTVFLVKMMQPS